MSILSWLKSVTHGDGTADLATAPAMHFAEGEQEFHGLDMKEALDAHLAWVQRLEMQLYGAGSEQLEIAKVAGDHHCTLGKWIHGAAKQRFAALPEYGELRQAHADFHLQAGAILNDVQNGDKSGAEGRMKQIRHKSGMVQLALIRLYSVGV